MAQALRLEFHLSWCAVARRKEHGTRFLSRAEKESPNRAESVDAVYPHRARWVDAYGWVEIGHDEGSRSFVRTLDDGGTVWEGEARYPTLAAALAALDAGIGQWLHGEMDEE